MQQIGCSWASVANTVATSFPWKRCVVFVVRCVMVLVVAIDCGNVVSSNPNLENKTKRSGFNMIMYGKEKFWSECGLPWCRRHELEIAARHCILAEIDGHGEAAWPNTSHKTDQFKHWMSPFLCIHDLQPHRCNISTAALTFDYKGPTWEHYRTFTLPPGGGRATIESHGCAENIGSETT